MVKPKDLNLNFFDLGRFSHGFMRNPLVMEDLDKRYTVVIYIIFITLILK